MDRLTNTVRPYAWGSTTAIPELLGTEPTGRPQAEIWMGAHPGAPSRIDRGTDPVALSEVIAADPEGELGPAVVEGFGPRLPFLLKVLAAASPLSLQVHPDRSQAEEGFAAEQSRGISLDAPHRNYKDANHKPELIAALTPFDGLCGFRHPHEAAELLELLNVDGLKPYVDTLRARPENEALREVFTAVLSADRDALADTVSQAASAAEALSTRAAGAAAEPAAKYAAAYAAYAAIARHYPGDPGVIAAMLLNYVRLQPGEALFLGAGVPHAYLDGLGVEIMANSDNVLRCGLTPKHVDVPELLRIVRFEPRDPGVLHPEPSKTTEATEATETTVNTVNGDNGVNSEDATDGVNSEEVYAAPIDEFRLSRCLLARGAAPLRLDAAAPQILLCTAGRVVLRHPDAPDGAELVLTPGESAYARAREGVLARGDGTLFRATVAV